MLQQRGTEIVDESGAPVRLRGVGLGGWMNMENFITGYPGSEQDWRAALHDALGESRYHLFFERLLTDFFDEDDAAFLPTLGLTLLRLPINYRHFESDMAPFDIREEGFRHLDRAIDLCARHGIYTIIDLHAVQGYQNQDWHSDNPTHRALLWTHKHFQDRAVHLWEVIADRYRGNRWVAGYNLINEPNDPTRTVVVSLQRRMIDAIRAIDPDHLIFLDGNAYGSDLTVYTEHIPGVGYDWHDYAPPGWINGGPYPGYTGELWCDRAFVERAFGKRRAIADGLNAPLWIGEFGPVYSGDPERDAMRYALARDQIEVFDAGRAHWSIWTYKDIGLQGVVYAAPDSPWMKALRPALAKKSRLGSDSWGGQDTEIRHIMGPIENLITTEFPDHDPITPMGWRWSAERLVRAILFGEALLPDFVDCLRGLSDDDLAALAASFALRNCVQRDGLAGVLSGTPAAT
jgi:aryl-phospho-beta-D-glucosidase BglC (GH1 family)